MPKRLPDHIEIATFQEVSDHVTKIWRELFTPGCLGRLVGLCPANVWDHVEVGLNVYALSGAIANALTDIERWAKFHLATPPSGDDWSRPDRHKYAGFLAKWIAKERPIYLRSANPSEPCALPEEMYRLNSFFAVAVMQSYLNREMTPVMADELTYVLHFRDEKGETLAFLAYCAEAAGN